MSAFRNRPEMNAAIDALGLVPVPSPATPPPQPATPAAILRWAADRAEAHSAPYASLTDLRRWADELDTAPAACTCPTIGAGHSPDCPTHGTGTTGMASGDGVAGPARTETTDEH
jgi:hypothetical protein